ncbi:hypothetical protein [Cryobacterium sp. PAMC25264]|uniref:hypothetical protein n=1 Tax=Cryobacterium sp. PAMC25264 TaxID=2861288 RepID=UPI001C627DEF|nr:hypothetical protein [Cryobacterium sp. PAMC25264]QYF74364.1 hypothetical protein KY500_03920 [Cryobacterium sp. PAMC25264]
MTADSEFVPAIKTHPTAPAGVHHCFSAEEVALAESRVVQTGVLDKLAAWRQQDARSTSAWTSSASISDRAVLVGFLLLAGHHSPLWIRSLADVFQYQLSAESRALLDLPEPSNVVGNFLGERGQWRSRTSRAVHRLLAPMDPFPQGRRTAATHTEVQAALDAHDTDREKRMRTRLNEFTEGFLHMTFMQQQPLLRQSSSHIDLAIEDSFVASPTRRGYLKKTLAQKVATERDADPLTLRPGPVEIFAGSWIDRKDNGRHDFGWGWAANVAVRVDSRRPGEARFPELAISATLSMPNIGAPEEAASLLRAALGTGLSPAVAYADSQYWAKSPSDGFGKSAFPPKLTPSVDRGADQRNIPVKTDGWSLIDSRKPMSFQEHDGTRSYEGIVYGTAEWDAFHSHARSSAENFTAGITNRHRENLGKSSHRAVRGFAAAQVFVTVLLTNYNLREIASFESVGNYDDMTQAPAPDVPATAGQPAQLLR